MDANEFEDLAESVRAKTREARRRARREAAADRLGTARDQASALSALLDDLASAGGEPDSRASAALSALKEEESALARTIGELDAEARREAAASMPPPSPPPPAAAPKGIGPRPERAPEPPAIAPEEKADLVALKEEIKATDPAPLADDERAALMLCWALRWRISADRVGQERVQRDTEYRFAFAKMREYLDRHQAQVPRALRREALGDWKRELGAAEAQLAAARGRDRATQRLLDEIVSFAYTPEAFEALIEHPKDGDANARTFRHLVRQVAKNEACRAELAEVCRPQRGWLGDEFAFLWKGRVRNEEAEAPLPARMSNRDILARVLRRMLSKAIIGACHAPAEKLYRGFAAHDTDRAKAAIEMLTKAGVLRAKSSEIGLRMSVEPERVGDAARFLSGQPLGAPAVDEWCAAGNGMAH